MGHASDKDSRPRQLMLSDCKGQEGGRLKIDWDGWLLTVSIDKYGDASKASRPRLDIQKEKLNQSFTLAGEDTPTWR